MYSLDVMINDKRKEYLRDVKPALVSCTQQTSGTSSGAATVARREKKNYNCYYYSKTKTKEEEQQPVPAQETPSVSVKSIQLCQLVDAVEQAKIQRKTAFIMDLSGYAHKFFKYKGNVIDVSEFCLKCALGHVTAGEFHEATRQQLHWGLKKGYTCVLYFDKLERNAKDVFEGAGFWSPDHLFDPVRVLEREFAKQYVLKDEEDVDFQNNKGCFFAHADFTFAVLTNNDYSASAPETIREALKKLGLDAHSHQMEFIKVLEME